MDPDKECEQGCPHYSDIIHDALHDKIYLNVAVFRDCICPCTFYKLFHKAKNPKHIYVQLIQQRDFSSNLEDDKDCWLQFCEDYLQLPGEEFKNTESKSDSRCTKDPIKLGDTHLHFSS